MLGPTNSKKKKKKRQNSRQWAQCLLVSMLDPWSQSHSTWFLWDGKQDWRSTASTTEKISCDSWLPVKTQAIHGQGRAFRKTAPGSTLTLSGYKNHMKASVISQHGDSSHPILNVPSVLSGAENQFQFYVPVTSTPSKVRMHKPPSATGQITQLLYQGKTI